LQYRRFISHCYAIFEIARSIFNQIIRRVDKKFNNCIKTLTYDNIDIGENRMNKLLEGSLKIKTKRNSQLWA